jgi:GT2 family glycosyltransferase/O-antigen/teichoic acid export membrane protein
MTTDAESRRSRRPVLGSPISGLARLAMWSYVSVGASAGGALVIAAIAIHRLGAQGYGQFALVMTMGAVVTLADASVGLAVVRAAARESAAAAADRDALRRMIRCAHIAGGWAAAVLVGLGALLIAVQSVVERASGHGLDAQQLALTGLVTLATAAGVATLASVAVCTGRRLARESGTAMLAGAALSVLTLSLTIDPLGIAGLGCAELVFVAVSRGSLVLVARRAAPWLRTAAVRAERFDRRLLAGLSLPLVVIAVGWQLVEVTDTVVVTIAATTASLGLYRLGSLIPSQVSALLFRAQDSLFPLLSASADDMHRERATRVLSAVVSALAGVLFTVIALERDGIVRVVGGTSDSLAAAVLACFCAVWLGNTIQHGLALLLIARRRERVYLPLVVGELLANLVLTIVLVRLMGPVGAALATLVTIVTSNVLLLPVVVRRETNRPAWRLIAQDAGIPATLGSATALAVVALAHATSPTMLRLLLETVVAGTIAVGVALWALGRADRLFLVAVLRQPRHDPRQRSGAHATDVRAALGARPRSGGDGAPLVSVVIPCYNHASFLPDAVGSARAQTHPRVEILVVNDGSTDATSDVARSLGVRVIEQRNLGLAAARNAGLDAIAGDYVVFLDADDTLSSDYVTATLAALESSRDVAYAYTQTQTFGRESLRSAHPEFSVPRLLQGNFIHASALLRTPVIAATRYDERIRRGWEDWDVYLRLAAQGMHGVLVDGPLLFYRKHGDAESMTDRFTLDARRRAYRAMLWRHRRLLKEPGVRRGSLIGRMASPLWLWSLGAAIRAGGTERSQAA